MCWGKIVGTLIFDRPERKRPGKNRVVGKFANQDSSRSVYWIVTRERREIRPKREEERERYPEGERREALALYKRGALIKSRVLIF